MRTRVGNVLAGAEADLSGPPPEPGAQARLDFPGAPAEGVPDSAPHDS